MTNHVENCKSNYNKYAKNLLIKIENFFKTGYINKWDLNKKDNFE